MEADSTYGLFHSISSKNTLATEKLNATVQDPYSIPASTDLSSGLLVKHYSSFSSQSEFEAIKSPHQNIASPAAATVLSLGQQIFIHK